MSRPFHATMLAQRLRCAVAAGCAALVLALTVFAASPVAHQWLHVDAHAGCKGHAGETAPVAPEPSDADDCAVVLFASGVSLPVGPVAITPPMAVVQSVSPVTAADVFLVSPRYLRQPERGPPSLG